jgi:nucleoside-triphosphatase THEP1
MNYKNNIFIITGEVRTGKTLLISNVISSLLKSKVKVAGVYSPARFEGDVKTGIYLIDISSQVKRLLADYQPGWDPENPKREWKMDPEVLSWGNEILRKSEPTEVLIIDELGFLEFEKKQGWTSAFGIIERNDFKIAIVVVRTGLLENAIAKWPAAKIIYIESPSQIKVNTDFLIDQVHATIAK